MTNLALVRQVVRKFFGPSVSIL